MTLQGKIAKLASTRGTLILPLGSNMANCFKDKTLKLNLSIMAMLPLSFAFGMCEERASPVAGGALAALLVANYIYFVRLAGVKFGNLGHSPRQSQVHLLVMLLSWLVPSVPWFLYYDRQDSPMFKFSNLVLVIVNSAVVSLTGTGRMFPIVGSACFFLRGILPMVLFHPGVVSPTTWTNLLVASSLLPVGWVKYRKEQSSMAFVPLALGLGSKSGATFGHNFLAPVWVVFLFFFAFFQMLWMREKRVLPASLRGCRFVSLAYLRKIAASGQGIQRCQDLPPEAFGDPSKAQYLVVVSHRWMDRYTCDVKTDACPEGLRLHMLLGRLEQVFSLRGVGQGTGCWGKLQRLQKAMTGGSDVLVFVDFMSLPQIGKSEDGEILPRTLQEDKIFQQCLPSMGVLYSMFPVVVSPEVAESSDTYMNSGWCFCESVTAWLGGQLTAMPSNREVLERFDLPSENDLQSVGRVLDASLERKTFLFETDRGIASTMVRCFVLKRRLVHALQNKLLAELQEVLQDMQEDDFESIVNQPVDASLNTPLHLAVAVNFEEGVGLLLEAGADKSLVNFHGDTPVQRFMLPRLGKAARSCRSMAGTMVTSQQSLDSFAKLAPRFTISSFGSTSCETLSNSAGLSPDPFALDRQEATSLEDAMLDIDLEAADCQGQVLGKIVSLDKEDSFAKERIDFQGLKPRVVESL